MPNYDVKVTTRVVTFEEVTHSVSASSMLEALASIPQGPEDTILSVTLESVDYTSYINQDQSSVTDTEAPPEPSTDSNYIPYSSYNEEATEEVVVETTDSNYVPYNSRTTNETQPQELNCEDDDCDPNDCDCHWEDSFTDEQRGVGSVYFPTSDEEDQGDYIPYNQRFGITSGFVPCSQLVDVTSTAEPVTINNGTEDGYVPYSQLKLTVE